MNPNALEKLRVELERAEPFRGLDRALGTFIGGHGQTLLGHFLPTRRLDETATRVELKIPDGDTLVGSMCLPQNRREVGLLHIFHGLSGSSESFYVPRAARAALEIGFAVVLWNHRGCGAGRGRALAPYHSGRSDDLARAVKWGRDLKREELWRIKEKGTTYVHGVLGYSLSGNATCLLAARAVPAIDSIPLSVKVFEKNLPGSLPDFAIAINPPFDLKKASDRLSHGSSRIYGQSFMSSLLQGLDDRADWKSENEPRETLRKLAERARRKLTVFTDVATFDAAYTGPAGGFRDHLDYYERASSGLFIEQAVIPLVILSADDDPITHGFADLPPGVLANFKNPLVLIDAQKEGGHMGYVDQATFVAPWKKQTRWLERRIQMYLRSFLSEGAHA